MQNKTSFEKFYNIEGRSSKSGPAFIQAQILYELYMLDIYDYDTCHYNQSYYEEPQNQNTLIYLAAWDRSLCMYGTK